MILANYDSYLDKVTLLLRINTRLHLTSLPHGQAGE